MVLVPILHTKPSSILLLPHLCYCTIDKSTTSHAAIFLAVVGLLLLQPLYGATKELHDSPWASTVCIHRSDAAMKRCDGSWC